MRKLRSMSSRAAWCWCLLLGLSAGSRAEEPGRPLNGDFDVAIDDLPPGKTVTIRFQAVIADPVPPGVSVITNQGTVTGTNFATVLTDDPDTLPLDATLTPLELADLKLTKTDSPDPANPGDSITYTIIATNAGPVPAETVVLTDNLPAQTTFQSLTSPGGWTCMTPAVGTNGAVSCSIPALGVGSAMFLLVVDVDPAAPGGSVIGNTATVSSSTTDPVPGDEIAMATTSIPATADLGITKTGPSAVFASETLVYTVTISNAGPDIASNVVVTDTTPTGLSFEGNAGDCTTAFPCQFASIPPGESRTITSTFRMPIDYAGPDPVVNSATVTSDATDLVPGNDQAIAETEAYVPSGPTDFYTLVPCRILDTRNPAGPLGGPAMSAGEERSFPAASACGIPATAIAISVNVTVTEPSAQGHLRIFASDPAPPFFSSLNYGASQTRGNNAVVGLNEDGEFTIFVVQPGGGTVQVIVDVNGYLE